MTISGGDGRAGLADAEIHSVDKELSIYRNEAGGNEALLEESDRKFDRWLVMKIQANAMAAFSDTGLNYRADSSNLLQFGGSRGVWYFGVNRVIEPYDNSHATRTGKGLCSICVRWKSEVDLNPPVETPTLPTEMKVEKCLDSGSCQVCCTCAFFYVENSL